MRGQRAGQGSGKGDARGRTVLGNGTLRHVDVDVEATVEIASESEMMRAAADVGESRLGRFLHDFAKLTGQGQLAFAIQHLDLS